MPCARVFARIVAHDVPNNDHDQCATFWVMESALRKHITLPKSAYDFLSDYRRREGLSSFSAAVEAAVEALRKQSLIVGYQRYAADYAASKEMQEEAETWLGLPMEAS